MHEPSANYNGNKCSNISVYNSISFSSIKFCNVLPEVRSESEIFEITDYTAVKGMTTKNCIRSERFTVGGYDWVIKFYPQGIIESVSDYVSVFVEVLNATKDFKATYCFCLWDWDTGIWSYKSQPSIPYTFWPSNGDDNWGYKTYIKRSELEQSSYLKDNKLRIKCTLSVIMPPPTPATASKLEGNEVYPKWSQNSSKYGFHIPGYAPPNAPSDMYPDLPRQPTVRIYCEAIKDFSVTARNGTVVLAPADPSDHYQHWIKDMSNGGTDGGGFPVFALVNRVTGQALKNPAGKDQPVSLVPYNDCCKDGVYWTEDLSTGFRAIRIKHNPSLNMTAVAKEPCKFIDGAKIIVQDWANTPVQHWNIVPTHKN